jgi:hypothetical protein
MDKFIYSIKYEPATFTPHPHTSPPNNCQFVHIQMVLPNGVHIVHDIGP